MEHSKPNYSQSEKEEMTVVHRLFKAPTLTEKIEVRRLQLVKDRLNGQPETQNHVQFPQEEMKSLAMLTGQWKLFGAESTDQKIADCRINGTESYDWVPGGHFLSGKWDMVFGSEGYKGVSIMGYNAVKEQFYMTNFDDAGYVRHYKVKICGNNWSITGNRERISICFSADGKRFEETREISADNKTWKLHCSINAVKLS